MADDQEQQGLFQTAADFPDRPIEQDAERPADQFRFSMSTAEVAECAAGHVPDRIRRVCYVAQPALAGDVAEHLRRLTAERDGALEPPQTVLGHLLTCDTCRYVGWEQCDQVAQPKGEPEGERVEALAEFIAAISVDDARRGKRR
jgi:hypothetical protein